MDTASLRLVLLNSVIALAAVVPATALTVYLGSCGVFGDEPGRCDFLGHLQPVFTFAMPSLGLMAASGIAYVVLLAIVGSFVQVNRLMALVVSPLAAVPLGSQDRSGVFSPQFVTLVGSYCVIIGLIVRLPAARREDDCDGQPVR